MLVYWHDIVLPSLLVTGGSVLLVSHSNTLRGLLSYLDIVPPARIPHIHIPNSVPCVYKFDPANSGAVVSPLLNTATGGEPRPVVVLRGEPPAPPGQNWGH